MTASHSGEDQTLARAEGAPLLISLELAAFLSFFLSFLNKVLCEQLKHPANTRRV